MAIIYLVAFWLYATIVVNFKQSFPKDKQSLLTFNICSQLNFMAKAKNKSEKKKAVSVAISPRTQYLGDEILKKRRGLTFSQLVTILLEDEAARLEISVPPDWVPPIKPE